MRTLPSVVVVISCSFVVSGLAVAQTAAQVEPVAKSGALLGSADYQPSAQRPVGWRGDGSGCYLAADPVAKWSAKENLLWTAEVGPGYSSPVVVGRRVFVTAEPDVLLCLDAATGKAQWQRSCKFSEVPGLPEGAEPPGLPTDSAGYATPTPVSDGQSVWVFFGTGVVACCDMGGKCKWIKWYDYRPTTSYGRTASPLLAGDRLLVHFGPLACLSAATGELLWTNKEAKAAYGTAAVARIGDTQVVITPKGRVVRVADGKTLAADLGPTIYTTPIVAGNIVYFVDRDMSAVKLSAKDDDKFECKELWFEELGGELFASAVLHDGRIYAVDRAAGYSVINAETGKVLLRKTLELEPAGRSDGPSVYSSPCLAGKYLFLSNTVGETVLLEPGDAGKVVGSGTLPNGSGTTPAFSGKRMFVRGGKALYCVGSRD
jgi:outer membrane protein assembly factor BamB